MALESTFRELCVSVANAIESLETLRVMLGDKPQSEAAIVDGIESAMLAILGLLHEANEAAAKALKCVEYPADLDRARRALATCQERCHHIEQQFSAELASYEKLSELARVGSERGREWLTWSTALRQDIEDCRGPLHSLSLALSRCWHELAERLGMTNISVQSIGQQIKVPSSVAADVETKGIT
jgi:hypothetical protein